MEARSLADINLLASNPPQYPVNPTEERRDHLVLYISRVPGTRDVILSPFKPQLKNVSPEDITSSLYYIHLDTSPPEPIHNDGGRSSGEGSPSQKNIPRKPLPGGVPPGRPSESDMPRISVDNPSADLDVAAPPHPPPQNLNPHPLPPLPTDPSTSTTGNNQDAHSILPPTNPPPFLVPGGGKDVDHIPPPAYAPPTPALAKYDDKDDDFLPPSTAPPASGSSTDRNLDDFAPPPTGPPPSFRVQDQNEDDGPPLPPRHLNLPSLQTRVPNRKPVTAHPSNEEPYSSVERSYDVDYSPRPSLSRSRPDVITSPQSSRGRNSRSQSPRKNTDVFSLVLIRRDPASGNQWNVGRITCHSSDSAQYQNAPDMSVPSALPYPPIDVQLENSGYAKFRKGMPRQSLDQNDDNVNTSVPTDPQPTDGSVFSRQVAMFYSKSWSTNVAEGFKKLDKNSFESFFKGHHSRNRSEESVGSTGSPEGPSTSIGQPMPGMKARGYIFASPWGTRCEFRTGDAGRSLRLHHLLHEGASTQLNRFLADVQGPDTPSAPALSELRFNLPSSEVFQQNPQDNQIKSLPQQQLGNLAKFWKRGENNGYDDYDDGEASPFDMNLGQELAGGGNRGKRAKMGKLIITHDGMKMLDLVVAANIGVWWKSWERNF